MSEQLDGSNSKQSGVRTGLIALMAAVLLVVGVWGYLEWRGQVIHRQRTENALSLQVLASRLGAVAILAQYDYYDEARNVASGVFDGIRNYGIQEGALPENYVTVLVARDSVMMALDRQDPEVRGRLVDLFFLLQLPVDTKLDPGSIMPATDSGSGITSPHRRAPAADTAPGVTSGPSGGSGP
jgi:hypothetical protein